MEQRLKNIVIEPSATIKEALRQMDVAGEKILFVVDAGRRLLGAVTDGDIRRWILTGRSLRKPISRAMNKRPIFLREGYSKEDARELILTDRIECLPVLNGNGTLVSALWWVDLFEMKPTHHAKIDAPVVIMAGGEGTRLFPFTKVLPKPLIPVGDKPIVETIIDTFCACGCKHFHLLVGYKSNLIKAYFSDFAHDYTITYTEESKPLGTAGGLGLLKNKLRSTFFISNCDILVEADYGDILKFHKENGHMITLVGSMKHFTIPYGVCEIRAGGGLKNINEKPEYDFLVNTGVYLIEPQVLSLIPRDRFYPMTDLINACVKAKKKVGVYPVSEKSWLDMGQWEELQKMLRKFEVH